MGKDNSGYRNSGDWNSGDWNSGDSNSGDRNSGDRNSGDWNSGDWNSGFFNSNEPTVRMFNSDTGKYRKEIKLPDFIYRLTMTDWVNECDMTKKEKEENPSHKTTGGYLKRYEYKEAWRRLWDETPEEERKQMFDLPNFDRGIFAFITGIDVEKSDEVEIIVEGNKKVISRKSAQALNLI